MTYKLKNTNVMPPGGWQFFQPETGWRMPNPMSQSYTKAVQLILQHRMANPAKKLSTDPIAVGAQLQNFIAHQIRFDPNHCEPADPDVKKKLSHPAFLQNVAETVRSAVSRMANTAKGAGVLAEWLGDGGVPVSPGEAQRRADICLKCPNNKPRRGRLAFAVARSISAIESAKSGFKLEVKNERALKTCTACDCQLQLKVWVPLKHIKSPDDETKFPEHCWIRQTESNRKLIVVRRKSAFGDAIQSTGLVPKLAAQNVEIAWEVDDPIVPLIDGIPDVDTVRTISDETPTVNLDATYELHKQRGQRHIADLFVESANPQLEKAGLVKVDSRNWFPSVRVDPKAREHARNFMSKFQKPWIVISPRSNSWTNREVPFSIWAKVKESVQGTFFWVGTERCGSPIVDAGCRTMSEVAGFIAHADLVATVDTGPMHVAAALKIPIVAVQQAFRLDLRLTDQMDWIGTGALLPCLGCDKYVCPIVTKGEKVPCCNPEPKILADAINRKLGIYKPGTVSALIPVFHPDIARLQKAVAAVIDQVDEVIVAVDGPKLLELPKQLPSKVRIVQGTGDRRGFGKTCNRGARETSSEFILMLNDDCYLDAHAVSQMKITAKNKDVAVVGCLLRYPDGTIQHGGTVPVGPLRWGHVDHGKRTPTLTDVTEMDYVTFAAALVRRKAFYEAQCFDERYDTYNEDSDLCLTLRQRGWKILYNPKAEGIHEESRTTSPMKAKLSKEGQQIMELKWQGKL